MAGQSLYCAAQVRELDRRAIENEGIPGYTLMTRAGEAAFRAIRALYPEARRLLVCCGSGNNGGDGYVVARLAVEAGFDVQVFALQPIEKLTGDARRAADDWAGVPITDAKPDNFDVIVDAVLGTGLNSDVRDPVAGWIERVNQSLVPVIAVDVPSGISVDTGMALGCAVEAAVTISFIGRKRGLYTGESPRFCGRLIFDNLDVPDAVYADLTADSWLLDASELGDLLPPRQADTHKGQLGHVLVAGSDLNYPGACMLGARAALRCGSGLVSVATRRVHAEHLAAGCPEAMWASAEDEEARAALLRQADVVALGPGLGQSQWSHAVWQQVMACGHPLVVDADALNLLAGQNKTRSDWVITPHPGEAARLLETDVAAVQADRFRSARVLSKRFNAVVVLKGAGSLIADPCGRVAVCARGCPAMASAGMGDALTGIIASLLGQGLSAFDAACAGVLLHALSAEAVADNQRTILASDVIETLPRVLP